jgi:hypothetical protein
MNLQKIDELIGKFEKGETSLEEEKQMKAFFLDHEVPFHLKKYQEIFSYYKFSRQVEISPEGFNERILRSIEEQDMRPINKSNKRNLYLTFAIAATILVLLGIFFRKEFLGSENKETYQDPMIAYAETKKILLTVSQNLNSGVSEMKSIKEFNNGLSELEKVTAFQSGMKQIEKVSLFDKAKEMITTKNN